MEVGRQINIDRIPDEQRPKWGPIDVIKGLSSLVAGQAARNKSEKPLAVPLSLIEAVWEDATLPDTVNVAMRGTVWWDGQRWSLETRA